VRRLRRGGGLPRRPHRAARALHEGIAAGFRAGATSGPGRSTGSPGDLRGPPPACWRGALDPGAGSPVAGCRPGCRFAGTRARRQPQGAGSPGSVATRISPTHEGPGNRRRVDGRKANSPAGGNSDGRADSRAKGNNQRSTTGGCVLDLPVRPHRRASERTIRRFESAGGATHPATTTPEGVTGVYGRAALAPDARAFEVSTPGSARTARGEHRRLSGRGRFRAGQVHRFAGGSAGVTASLLGVALDPSSGSPGPGCMPGCRFAGIRARRQPRGAGSPGSVATRISPTREGPGNRRRADG
jgi:hypothetical protein